ncbi:hypothetical protein OE88DRAFT_1645233 [Heliocybe sulcata]|uniref:Uncharacterized protein n=1 Tax=Heliocybe sulcata TaxID=5364 RepID=A0A5C3N1R3_9AGAM|nr:hypothetical protein OE88DRAFT_1645233 [Heliocybe sulcata]
MHKVLGYSSTQQPFHEQLHLVISEITDQVEESRIVQDGYGSRGRRLPTQIRISQKRYGAGGRRPREHVPRFIPPRMLRLQQEQIARPPWPKDRAPLSFLGGPDRVAASHGHSQQSVVHQSSRWSFDQHLQSIPVLTTGPVTAHSGQLRMSQQGRSLPRNSQQYAVPPAFNTQGGPNRSAVAPPTWYAFSQPMPQVPASHTVSVSKPQKPSNRRSGTYCVPVKIAQQGALQRSDDAAANRDQNPEQGLLTYWPPPLHGKRATMFDPFGDRSEEEWLATAVLAAHDRSSHPETSAFYTMSSSGTQDMSDPGNMAASASAHNIKSSPLAMASGVVQGQRTYGIALFPTSTWGTNGLKHANMMCGGSNTVITEGDTTDGFLAKEMQGPRGSNQVDLGISRQEWRGGDRHLGWVSRYSRRRRLNRLYAPTTLFRDDDASIQTQMTGRSGTSGWLPLSFLATVWPMVQREQVYARVSEGRGFRGCPAHGAPAASAVDAANAESGILTIRCASPDAIGNSCSQQAQARLPYGSSLI